MTREHSHVRYTPPVFIQSLADVDSMVLETYVMNEDGSAIVIVGGKAFVSGLAIIPEVLILDRS